MSPCVFAPLNSLPPFLSPSLPSHFHPLLYLSSISLPLHFAERHLVLLSCDIHTHTPARKVLQTSSCTILSCKFVLRTVLVMGMGMNVTAHFPITITITMYYCCYYFYSYYITIIIIIIIILITITIPLRGLQDGRDITHADPASQARPDDSAAGRQAGHVSIYPSIHPSIHIYLHIFLSIYIFMYLSVYPAPQARPDDSAAGRHSNNNNI